MSEVQQARDDNNLKALKRKNAELGKAHRQAKEQLEALQKALDLQKQKEDERAQTLLCINRLWTQLNTELQHLSARLDCQAVGQVPSDAEVAETAAAAEAISDPYLRRLVLGDPASIKAVKKADAGLRDGLSDVELVLTERATATQQAFTKVLEALQQRSAVGADLAAKIAESSADTALKEENERLSSEVARLQNLLDASHAKETSTAQLLRQAEDNLLASQEKQTELDNALADKEAALMSLKRKLVSEQERVKEVTAAAEAANAAATAAGAAAGSGGTADAAYGGADAAAAGGRAGSADPAALPVDVREQLADLQRLLSKREEEFQKEHQAHLDTKRELQESRSRVADESWVPRTQTFQSVLRDNARLKAELEGRLKELEKAAAEKTEMANSLAAHHQHVEAIRIAREAAASAKTRAETYHVNMLKHMDEAQKAQRALAAHAAAQGQPGTVERLTAQINSLQQELEAKQLELQKNLVAGEAVDTAMKQLAAARAQAEAHRAQVALLAGRLRDKTAAMVAVAAREASLQDRLGDLQAFVEVLTTYSLDTRDAVEVRRSERELSIKVQALERAAQTQELQQKLAAAIAIEGELRTSLDEAHAAADVLRGEVAGLKVQVNSLEERVADLRRDCDVYIQDITNANEAFEDAQQQNSRSLQQLSERDQQLREAMEGKLVLQQQLEQLQVQIRELQDHIERLKADKEAMGAMKEAAEKDFAKLSAELAQAREALRAQSAAADRVGRDLRAKDNECITLAGLLEKERDAATTATKRAADEAELAAKEKLKRQRLEEKQQALQGQVKRLEVLQHKDAAVAELEQQVEGLRKLVKCSVCEANFKQCCITKCMHMFCNKCVDARVTGRNRKCPGCGIAFSANEVRAIHGLEPGGY